MRKVVKTEKELTLEQLIPVFGENKEKADAYAKVAKVQNSKIKEKMAKLLKNNATSIDKEVGDWICTYQVRSEEIYDEAALLDYVKKSKVLQECVETVEVVNFQKVEDILFKLKKESEKKEKKILTDLDKFRSFKNTQYLYIKRKKKED